MANIRNEYLEILDKAFSGVVLGDGISLRDAEVVDSYGSKALNRDDWQANVVNDWKSIPIRELRRDNIAHLDAEGFRYYIPALTLAILDHYEPGEMWCIGTMSSLYPRKNSLANQLHLYKLLDERQKACLAWYLSVLTQCVDLQTDDETIVKRALRNFWSEFL